MTTAAVRTRVTSFAPQFLVDDLERSIGREKRRSHLRLGRRRIETHLPTARYLSVSVSVLNPTTPYS